MNQATKTASSPVRFRPIYWYVVAAIVLAVVPLLNSNDFILTIFQGLAISYLAVLGLNLLQGYAGLASFGQAGFVAIGAYIAAIFATRVGLPFWVGFVIGPCVAAGIGAIIAVPISRARGPFYILITTGFGLAVWNICQTWVDVTGGPTGIAGIPRPSLFGYTFDGLGYTYLVFGVGLIMTLLAGNLMGSRWGRSFVAMRDAPNAAESLGLNTVRLKMIAFALAGFYGGMAGVFMAHRTGFLVSDNFGVWASMIYIMMVIVGGPGTITGALVGTVLLGALPQIFAPIYTVYNMILGVVIIVVLIYMRDGITGTLEKVLADRFGRKNPYEGVEAIPWSPQPRAVPDQEGGPLLECKSIKMTFGGIKAIDGVDMVLWPGKVRGLMGPNGSGKTTLINVITGFYTATDGAVKLGQVDTTKLKAHSVTCLGIARTFQTPEIFKQQSVLDNVMVGFNTQMKANFFEHLLRLPNAVKEENHYKKLGLGLLEYFGLREWAHLPAGGLSYGHQKLLEIARAMAVQPSLLILDEPAGGAGQAEIVRVQETVNRLRSAGISVLMIEHHTDMLMDLADQMTVLDFGKRIADGTPAAVKQDPRVLEAYLGAQEEVTGAKN